jgi:L-lactate dehydrogenase complex protein LldF
LLGLLLRKPEIVLKESDILKPIPNSSWPLRANETALQYKKAFSSAGSQFNNLSLARDRAAFTRWKTIENLDKYLIEFEANFIKSGGKLLWAQDITDVMMEVISIIKKSQASTIIKSKSRTSSEVGLTDRLSQEGFSITETDCGDYILQQCDEEGSHMVLPALHKPIDEIVALLKDDLQLEDDADPATIIAKIRTHLRSVFLTAGVGITGANFIVADPGAIVITENEGNAGLTTSIPKIHIVIAGIDKLLPSLSDLDLFLPLLSTYGTGQTITAYNHIISGPRQSDEMDGPEELYVILVDNGRTNVLAQDTQRQALSCIQCGACQYACPVYRATTPGDFPSPVEAITIPLKTGDPDLQKLSYASTLCGACKDVCPVKIDLPKLLLQNRKDFVDQGNTTRSEKLFYYVWKRAMLKRDRLNWKGIKAGKFIMENLYKSKDGLRKMPLKAPKSFNEQMREKRNIK